MKDSTGKAVQVGDQVSFLASSYSKDRLIGIISSIAIHDCQAINCGEQGKQSAIIQVDGKPFVKYGEDITKE